jgi:hypothetical protein
MTYSKSIVLILVCVAIFSFGCKKKDSQPPTPSNGTYRLQFSSSVNGKPLHFDSTYRVANGKIQLTDFSFFIGQPRLVRSDGTEVPLSNELLVAFTPYIISNPNRDRSSVDTAFSFTVPAGSYRSIRFGLGVPPQYNAGANFDPFKWPQYSALGAKSEVFWIMPGAQNAYHFIYMQGTADTFANPNKPFRFCSILRYHIMGIDSSNYRQMEIPANFTVAPGSTIINAFPVDIARIFSGRKVIDLKTRNETDNSNAQQYPLGNLILDNMQDILEGK